MSLMASSLRSMGRAIDPEPEPARPPEFRRIRDSLLSQRDVALCIALLLVALGLRLYRLDHQNFWIDEVYQQYVAARPARDIVREYSLRADGGPLSLLVSHFFLSSSFPEWTARLPSAIFGALAVVATALIGRAILPGRVPWIGAAFLAVSPLHVWYSQEARWYAQWVCFTALSYLAFLHAVRWGSVRSWIAYAVATAFDLYTFVLSFVVVTSQALSASQLSSRVDTGRERVPRWFAVQIGVVIAAAPLVDMMLRHRNAVTGSPRPNTLAAIPYTVFAYAVGFSLGPPLGALHGITSVARIVLEHPVVPVVFLLFVPLLLVGVVRVARDREAAGVLLPWLLGPPLLVSLLALFTGVTYEVRYTVAALPAFALVLAAGICALPRRLLRLAAGGAVAACALVALGNHYWNPRYAKEDVRGAVVDATRSDPSAPIVVVGQARAAVWFYGKGARIAAVDGCEPNVPAVDPVRAAALLEVPALWVVVSRDWDNRAEGCLARLFRTHVAVEHRWYAGAELWRLVKRSGIE